MSQIVAYTHGRYMCRYHRSKMCYPVARCPSSSGVLAVVTSPNWEALRSQLTRDSGVMQGIQVCAATGCSALVAVATVAVRAAAEEQ